MPLTSEQRKQLSRLYYGPMAMTALESFVEKLIAEAVAEAMTKAERAVLRMSADWHGCRLTKAERELSAGTPCDDCIAGAHIAIRAKDE